MADIKVNVKANTSGIDAVTESLSAAGKVTAKLSKEEKRLQDQNDKILKGYNGLVSSVNKFSAANNNTISSLTGVLKKSFRLDKAFKQLRAATAGAGDASKKLNINKKALAAAGIATALKGTFKLSKALGKGGLRAASNMASRGISLLGQRLIGLNEGFGRIIGGGLKGFVQGLSDLARGAITRAGSALSGFIKKSVSQFSELDKASREIAIFSGTVDSQFGNFNDVSNKFRKSITDTASQTMFSSEQIAAAMSEIASIGQFETPEQLETLTETAAVLATATGADMEFAGALLARTMNAFSASLDGATNAAGELLSEEEKTVAVANVLARAANDSALSMAQLGDAMQYVSPLAVAAGVSLQESVSMVAALSNMGFNASRAGTAIAQALEALTAPSAGAAAAMESIDFTAFDDQGNMKDMGTIIMELKDRMSQLGTEEEKLAVMNEMFGTRAGRAMMGLMNDTDQYANLLGALAKDSEDNFNLIAEANKAMMKSVAGQFSMLEGKVDGIRMAFVSAIEPLLTNVEGTGLLNTLNNLITDPQIIGFFQELTNTIGGLINVINDSAGSILTGLISVLNMLLPILSIVIEAFALFFADLGNGTSIFGVLEAVLSTTFEVIAQLVPMILNIFATLVPVIMPIIQQVSAVVMSLLPIIALVFNTIAEVIIMVAPVIQLILGLIQQLMPTFMLLVQAAMILAKVFVAALLPVIGLFAQIIAENIPLIQQIVIFIMHLVTIISALTPVIMQVIRLALTPLISVFRLLLPIIGLVIGVINVLMPIITGIVYLIGNILAPILGGILDIVDLVVGGLVKLFNFFSDILIDIAGVVSKAVLWILDKMDFLFVALKTITETLADVAEFFGMDEMAAGLRSYVDMMDTTINATKDGLSAVEDFANSGKSLEDMAPEVDMGDGLEADLDFDFGDFEDDPLATVDNPQLEFPVEGDFQNLEVDEGVVQLRADDGLQRQAEQAEELFGSISNILAVQEIAGALLGTAAAGLNGEGAGNGMAGQQVTDNSVTNSNNTAVENITINVGSDETVDIENTDATQIIASTFKKISDGMS